MKKLMTMIASVAMAFGLFATEATPFSISFEAEEGSTKGISEGTFTPPTDEGEWAWTGSPFALSQYTNAEKLALPYDAEGPKARRADMFDVSENDNYLPLNTSNEELTRTVGEGNMFLDQLVKFTGFEDPQTNLTADAKIAVWMSEFWNDDETEAETNLYVTVGKVDDDGNVKPVALKIDGTSYKLDTWYRLSIRSLGNVTPLATNGRAGFVIYVNGNKVSSLDADARALISEDELTVPAKNYMKKGQLFLAIDDTNADFTKVSYKGIGAIDDIILDANGPEFMNDTTEVTFAGLADGAVIAKVVDADENEFDYPTEAIEVKQGQLTVTLEAEPGYKLFGQTTYTVDTADAEEGVITIDADETRFEAVVAKLNDTIDLAESELANALTALTEGNEIAIVAECSILGDEDATLYSFTPNTTITGTAGGWNIEVASYDEGVNPGNLEIGADIAADFTLNVTLDDVEAGDSFMFAGDVAGTLEANAVEVTDAITVSGTLTAEALAIDETITLSGDGKVETKSPVEDGQILGEDEAKIEPVPDTPEMGWTTYQIKQAPDTVEVTFANGENSTITPLAGVSNLVVGTKFAITATAAAGYEFAESSYEGWAKVDSTTLKIEEYEVTEDDTITAPNATAIPYVASVTSGTDTFKFETAEAALAKVQALEADPANFPITVTCLADQLVITVGEAPAQQSVTLAKDKTIVITADSWKFDAFAGNVVLAPGKTIKAKSLVDGAAITTIAGCKVVKSDTTDEGGYYTWTVQAIEYATLAVDADEGITYTLTNKTTEAVVEAGYKADIDNAEVIEAIELAFEEGYELNAAASTTSVTLNTAETKTIVLKKQLKTFDITFTDAAEWTNVVSTAYGATPAPTELVPEKVGYTFTGWNPAITTVTGAATYTAVYTVNEYDVTFSTNNIPVAEAATKVAHGAKLEAAQIPPFEGGTWDVDPTTAEITCATNFNYTISAPAPVDPVNPGEEKSYEKPEEAQAAAEYINDNKATMINVPKTVPAGSENAYLDRVAAKVVGETKVVVDIADGAKDTFKGELDEQMEDAAAELTDATAATASITTVPGFYYWVEGGVEVGTIKTNGEAVLGDGTKQELTKPTLGTTTKAFYKLAVGIKDPASTPKEDK